MRSRSRSPGRRPLPNAVTIEGLGDLRYDWHAIGRLTDEIGKDFDARISAAARDFDVDVIARVVAIGLGGDWTADAVKDAAPPMVPTVSAVLEALNVAFHGQREAPPADPGAANPPKSTSSNRRKSKRSAPG